MLHLMLRLQVVFTLPPSGRGSFVIHTPALGRPAPVRTGAGVFRDVWLVRVNSGKTTAVPQVTLRKAEQLEYVFTLCLPPALPLPLNATGGAPTAYVTYPLQVFLVKGGVNTTAFGNFGDDVYKRFEASPVTFEADVRVPRELPIETAVDALVPSAWPLVNGFDASLSTRRRKCTARDINALGEGWALIQNAQSQELPWLSTHLSWQPSACELPAPNGDVFRRALAGRWLAYVGDSSMLEQAKLALYTIGIEPNSSMEFHFGDAKNCRAFRLFDTGISYSGMEGLRVSHFWDGGPTACHIGFGIPSFLEAAFVANLESRLTLGGRPDILIFNSGLHDRGKPLATYAASLEVAFKTLRRIVGPKCVLVWKSTLASTIEAITVFEEYNAVALELLERFAADGPVAIIDQYAVTLTKFVLGERSTNPNHCADAWPADLGCLFTVSAVQVLLGG